MTFKYFAYGSNMLTERLRARCSSAKPIQLGTLNGYSFEFSKPSIDTSGKATIVKSGTVGARVWSVLFDVDTSDLDALDKAEGYGNGYDRRPDFAVNTSAGESVKATTYFAMELDRTLKPYDWYRALVIAGAKQHDLPKELIAELERVEFTVDRGVNRKSKREALAALREAGYENHLEEQVVQ